MTLVFDLVLDNFQTIAENNVDNPQRFAPHQLDQRENATELCQVPSEADIMHAVGT